MDTVALIWFATVVQQGSFAAASRRLAQPSSTVSRRVARLEASLDCQLLLRTTRKLALTDEGEQLLPLANRLLATHQEVADWRDSHQSEAQGLLRLTAPSSFARGPLAEWLIDYRTRFPKVQTELIHSNAYLDFQAHQLDVAFRQGPLPDSALVAKRLFGIQYGVFAAPLWVNRYRLAEPRDLANVPCISAGVRGQTLPWRFRESVIEPNNVVMLFEDTEQCIQAAVAGLGCTYASRYDALPFVENGLLVECLQPDRAMPADFYMVTPQREHRSLKLSTFMSHIQSSIIAFGEPEGLVF